MLELSSLLCLWQIYYFFLQLLPGLRLDILDFNETIKRGRALLNLTSLLTFIASQAARLGWRVWRIISISRLLCFLLLFLIQHSSTLVIRQSVFASVGTVRRKGVEGARFSHFVIATAASSRRSRAFAVNLNERFLLCRPFCVYFFVCLVRIFIWIVELGSKEWTFSCLARRQLFFGVFRWNSTFWKNTACSRLLLAFPTASQAIDRGQPSSTAQPIFNIFMLFIN